jgi:hypothetical protein
MPHPYDEPSRLSRNLDRGEQEAREERLQGLLTEAWDALDLVVDNLIDAEKLGADSRTMREVSSLVEEAQTLLSS